MASGRPVQGHAEEDRVGSTTHGTNDGEGQEAPGGFKARLRWMFRERELLIRSEDRVRYLRLKPWMQGTAVGTVMALGLWATIGTGISYWQGTHLDRQDAEIVEAKLAYDRVRADLEAYRVRIGALAHDIFARQQEIEADEGLGLGADGETDEALAVDLEELAEISTRIEGAFDRIATDLDLTEADRRRIVQSRDALHARIRELETALADSREQGDRLTGEVGRLVAERDAAREARKEAETASADLSRTLARVRGDLAATDRREQALRGRVSALTDALEGAEGETDAVATERDRLIDRLAAVRDDLTESREARRAAERRVEHVVREMAAISGLTGAGDGSERDALAALERESRSVVSDLHKARRRAEAAESTLSEVVLSLARVAKESGVVRGAKANKTDATDGEGGGVTLPDVLASIAPQAGATADAEAPRFGDPVGHAEALLSEIEGLHDSQRTLVERLSEETAVNLDRTEALLRLAGLDVDAMLRRVGYEGGQGGPLVAATEGQVPVPASTPETYADDVEVLEARINRWRALQQVVRCVPLIAPLDNYHVTSSFGKRKDPFNGRWAMHEGVDLGGWPGIPILAAAPGTVISAQRDGGYGNKVVIDHGCGVRTVYGHMKSIAVKKGQRVDHRQTIGKLGSTGRSTGPHVHYEVQVDGEPVDPEKFIEAGKHVFKI